MATKILNHASESIVALPATEIEHSIMQLSPGHILPGLDIDKFAIAALEGLDWNAIGMSQDEAARLCWSMAEAMVRNKP